MKQSTGTYVYARALACVHDLAVGTLRVPFTCDRDLWAYKLARRNKLISRLIEAACISLRTCCNGRADGETVRQNDDLE